MLRSLSAFRYTTGFFRASDLPKEMKLPPLTIPVDKLDFFLAHTEKGGVASTYYPQTWVQQLIANTKAGKPAPPDPMPGE